ncbi:MAG TPA: carbamoyltransferase [Cyclobacteriaceae bacterium]
MNSETYILGISAFYHDAAAAIIKNGEIIAAAQEERFTRVKHDPRFPVNAINYCLEEAFIEADDLEAVVFYDHPLLTWDRIVKNCAMVGDESYPTFNSALKSVLGIKLWVEQYTLKAIGTLGKTGKIVFAGHHMSHAASSFYPSPFEEAAILSLDGVGEWSTTTLGYGKGNDIKVLKEINYPHSLGLLYSAFTYYCGFKVNSGEYKLMGLAPYGKPTYVKEIYDHLIDVKADGSFRLNTDYFGYLKGDKTTNEKFHALFKGEPRKPETKITRKEMDLAASIQVVTEEIMIKIARHIRELTGSKNLCLSGGVALNCVANGKLLAQKIFDNIWIQPAAGDAGGALGAAFVAYHLYFKAPRKPMVGSKGDSQHGTYLGPAFSEAEIGAFLDRHNYPYSKFENSADQYSLLAKELDSGKILGFFSGRMEFGPRSLGARSIIGDARKTDMQSKMNLKIKYRESFRPFAPAVLAEDVSDYFKLDTESPYMLLVAPVKENLRTNVNSEEQLKENNDDMLGVINQARSTIPAVTHVDFSARIQTVHVGTNKRFYDLLMAFKALTGSSVLVNTSFNVRGEPIVCTPKDAYQCFMRTEIDILVLENFVLFKTLQPKIENDENWKQQYELD